MTVTCDICEVEEASHQCPICGRRVCDDHWVSSSGRCTVCSEASCQVCRANLAIGYCLSCGRLGCAECLRQLDNVRRICRECLYKVFKGDVREALTRIRGLRPPPETIMYTVRVLDEVS